MKVKNLLMNKSCKILIEKKILLKTKVKLLVF